MKKNKKGFTLIELLAVIVILAIIALIATPIVLNLIKRARLGAAQDSAYGLRKAAQLYYATSLTNNPNFSGATFECTNDGCIYEYTVGEETKTEKLDIDGTKPSSGTVTIAANGTITYSNIKYNNGAYTCNVPESGTIKCEEGDEVPTIDPEPTPEPEPEPVLPEVAYVSSSQTAYAITVTYTKENATNVKCEYGTDSTYNTFLGEGTIDNTNNTCKVESLSPNTTYYYKITVTSSTDNNSEITGEIKTNKVKVYTNGEVVYYNPKEGKACTESQYSTDLASYETTNNVTTPTGQKDGCMKWYAFNDSEGSTNVKLLLDHNTTAKVAYNSSNSNASPATIQPEINKLTSESKWKKVEDTPRLITADEIAGITGNTSFNVATSTSGFYFDSNNQTQTANATNKSNYAWLFDYTEECTTYGCNIADSSTYGYWTSSKVSGSSTDVWSVYCYGVLDNNYASSSNLGVRPVIETLKSNL